MLRVVGNGKSQRFLEECKFIRLPVSTKQGLYSKGLGHIKQGLSLSDHPSFDPKDVSSEDCEELQQISMIFLRYLRILTGFFYLILVTRASWDA